MKNTLLIIGMGPGLGLGIAEKFGSEGFQVGMISRSAEKLRGFQKALGDAGIRSEFATADIGSTDQMIRAIDEIRSKLGSITVLHYNAVDYRMKPLMEETADDLTNGFRISVANAFAAAKELVPDLKQTKGSVLLTGGGAANHPTSEMASISLGKAGIRNLAFQLNESLKSEGIFVGTVTVSGWISPDSQTHSPRILAQQFWNLYRSQDKVEVVY